MASPNLECVLVVALVTPVFFSPFGTFPFPPQANPLSWAEPFHPRFLCRFLYEHQNPSVNAPIKQSFPGSFRNSYFSSDPNLRFGLLQLIGQAYFRLAPWTPYGLVCWNLLFRSYFLLSSRFAILLGLCEWFFFLTGGPRFTTMVFSSLLLLRCPLLVAHFWY